MDVSPVDFVGVSMWLGLNERHQRIRTNALNLQVNGLAVHMLAICHTAFIGIVDRAPQTGDYMAGSAEVPPGIVADPYNLLLHPGGIAVAVPISALALEFLFCEKFNLIPESTRGRDSYVLINLQGFTGQHLIQCLTGGILPEHTVLFDTKTVL